MGLEIERKFKVVSDAWRPQVTRSERLRDGLIARRDGTKIRVRIGEQRATLAVKSKRVGRVRAEYEYEIPRADAERMMAHYCDHVLEKTRFFVPHAGFIWEVDVYDGLLEGVILAEVEIERYDVNVPLPDWVGEEVTYEAEFHKGVMVATRLADAETTPAEGPSVERA